MIRIPRWFVGILGVLFASFHAGLGISNISTSGETFVAIAALFIYVATVMPTIILYRGPALPISQAITNLAAAALIPLLVNSYLSPQSMSAYSTWYVMGVATLMAATAVRQQRVVAWIGTIVMVVQVIIWAGFAIGVQTGLLGALMLVFAGHAISFGLAKAYKETMDFTNQALEIEKQKIANKVASEVRRSKLEVALQGALPVLNLIKDQQGRLTESQKREAKLLEAALRDEIRGRELMNDQIRLAAKEARMRGVEVIILDEGGLAVVSEEEKAQVLSAAAAAISEIQDGRVTFRSPVGESWKATLVATRSGVSKPDVWLRF